MLNFTQKIYEDFTGKTATNIGANQGRAISQAGQEARNAYSQQYGIGSSQTLPYTAAMQAFTLGTSYENTPAFAEYQRLNPAAFRNTEDLQNQINILQSKIANTGGGGMSRRKVIANDKMQLQTLQQQLQETQTASNPFQGALFQNLKQGNFQSALESMPGYSATLGSGINALQNSAAGRGLQTGDMQKSIMNYGQNLAHEFLMQQLGGYEGVAQQGINSMNYGQNLGNMIYQPAAAASSAIANGQTAALGQRQELYNNAISMIPKLPKFKLPKFPSIGGGSSYGGSMLGGGMPSFV